MPSIRAKGGMIMGLNASHKDILVELYAEIPETVDELPYTDAFDELKKRFESRVASALTNHDFWRALSNYLPVRRTSLLASTR